MSNNPYATYNNTSDNGSLGSMQSEQLETPQQGLSFSSEQQKIGNLSLVKDSKLSSSQEIAQEMERGIIDIETLKATNAQLISTLDDVSKIQTEGRAKRQQAELELQQIEGDLKNKLMNMSQQSQSISGEF